MSKKINCCQVVMNINLNKKLSQKYSDIEEELNELKIDCILYNKKSHFLSEFKEQQIITSSDEYLKRKYSYKESKERLPKLNAYFKNYIQFFCKPFFINHNYNLLIQKYGEQKAQLYFKNNYSSKENYQSRHRSENIKVFNTTIRNNIDDFSLSKSTCKIEDVKMKENNQIIEDYSFLNKQSQESSLVNIIADLGNIFVKNEKKFKKISLNYNKSTTDKTKGEEHSEIKKINKRNFSKDLVKKNTLNNKLTSRELSSNKIMIPFIQKKQKIVKSVNLIEKTFSSKNNSKTPVRLVKSSKVTQPSKNINSILKVSNFENKLSNILNFRLISPLKQNNIYNSNNNPNSKSKKIIKSQSLEKIEKHSLLSHKTNETKDKQSPHSLVKNFIETVRTNRPSKFSINYSNIPHKTTRTERNFSPSVKKSISDIKSSLSKNFLSNINTNTHKKSASQIEGLTQNKTKTPFFKSNNILATNRLNEKSPLKNAPINKFITKTNYQNFIKFDNYKKDKQSKLSNYTTNKNQSSIDFIKKFSTTYKLNTKRSTSNI